MDDKRLLVLLAALQAAAPRSAALRPPLLPSYTSPPNEYIIDGAKYAYIVVGAGAAGCAAAARLALAGESVLLIEAGDDPDLLSRVPKAAMALLGGPMDWHYNTLPNNVSCLSSKGKQCRFSRGKCVGGSTSINYMLYTRGNRKDYDDYGIPGWTWQDLQPYFLRYEGLNPSVLDKFPASSKPYHNTRGIVKMEYFDDPKNPWHERIVEGYNSIGFDTNLDVNGVEQIGISKVVGYVSDGERMSTARAYLGKKKVQRRLEVAKNAYCTGVIFDKNKNAIGVTVVQGGLSKEVFAKKEVILSAGAIETPKILMLSGVGPAAHLNDLGIKLISDLPVGRDMSDHVLPLLIAEVDPEQGAVEGVLSLVGSAAELLLNDSGPLTSNGITDINAFFNASCYRRASKRLDSARGCELPTIQVIHAYVDQLLTTVGQAFFQHSINLNDNVTKQIAAINAKKPIMIISSILLSPYSRGYVELASDDPLEPPKIFPNYLSDERDVDELVRAIAIIEDLMETPPFKKRNAKLSHLLFPECPPYEGGRDAYWRCFIKQMTFSVFHSMGTCQLLQVVDAELRVLGVRRLRVADAGVYPRVMRGNPAAAAIAAGERLADFILGRNSTR